MRPFEDIFEEPDYSDVALLVAGVREWPSEDFAHELDARVGRRFAPQPSSSAPRGGSARRRRLPRWAAGPAVALVAGAVAAVVVLSNGGVGRNLNATHRLALPQGQRSVGPRAPYAAKTPSAAGSPYSASAGEGLGAFTTHSASNSTAGSYAGQLGVNAAAGAPVAPGSKQIQTAQISLTTPNQHVDQVAHEVFSVVGVEHGTVLNSHITAATTSSGGGYASFSLSIPTSNLQDAMTQLSRLRYAAVSSRTDSSQNVSHQYNADQRQLADAEALRSSLLKQLQTAYTQTAIDSIKAQLKLAEQQISAWQSTIGSLDHRISYSNVALQLNSGGLPVVPTHSSSFTIGQAGHDALRVLVVSAGVALIALAVVIPVGMVAALLVWLWVWLRQRRREHALDAAG